MVCSGDEDGISFSVGLCMIFADSGFMSKSISGVLKALSLRFAGFKKPHSLIRLLYERMLYDGQHQERFT